MKIEIHHQVPDYQSYRATRVKSLFNTENGCRFDLEVDLDIESAEWNIGVIVGPSGSGKSSMGHVLFGKDKVVNLSKGWTTDKPIIDCIQPEGSFHEVTGALAAVGLGDVPTWLRPFHVLSNGEQFRAGLARIICERPHEVVIDEFTSVVDRQIAQIGSQAFQKAWRRNNPKGKVVLLTPHYDILDWIQPDWVFDTKDQQLIRGHLRPRPRLELEIRQTDSRYWKYFKPHYYLDLPFPVAADFYVGTIQDELVSHMVVAPFFTANAYRATRLVTMPEWQGAGVGIRFLEWVCQYHLDGHGRKSKKLPTFFHTSHPQLCSALRKRNNWKQTSAKLYGENKKKSMQNLDKSRKNKNQKSKGTGYGGHFRPIQGFKYIGG